MWLVFLARLLMILLMDLARGDANNVCYSPYGCFTDNPPFDFTLLPLPQSPTEVGTRFLLYKRSQTGYQVLSDVQADELQKSSFEPQKPTKIIIHGYALIDPESSIIDIKGWWGITMKDELLKKDDYNVVIIDWIKGAKFPYLRSAANTRIVGAQVAQFLMTAKSAAQKTGSRLGPVHIIGFSLGAHVAGFVGRRMKTIGQPIYRITGLDPATVIFKNAHIDVRLDPSDAKFVDVIHSSYFLGISAPQGHRDFYPNGGKFQAGCTILDGPDGLVCHHVRSALYFTESINTHCPWRSYRCNSESDFDRGLCLDCSKGCPKMGYDADLNENIPSGKFYLYTAPSAPFCVYHYLITINTAHTILSGIDAHIYIILRGKKGASDTIKLAERDISRGSVESFVAKVNKDLGDLTNLTIWHNHVIEFWKVSKMTIRPGWNHIQYTACFNQWVHFKDKTTTTINIGNISC